MRKRLSTAADARSSGERDRRGRFSARRKRATVLRLLRGEDLESLGGAGLALACSWPRVRREEPPCPGSRCTPRSASCSWRTSCSTRRWTTWRPAALWLGGDRRDEWRPVDLRPSGVRHTTGLPRVGTGAVQRRATTRRGRAPHGAAGRSVPPGRGRHPSARPRFMAKGTGPKLPEGSAPRRNGCVDAGARPPVPRGSREGT